jgi:hypothetical protein
MLAALLSIVGAPLYCCLIAVCASELLDRGARDARLLQVFSFARANFNAGGI